MAACWLLPAAVLALSLLRPTSAALIFRDDFSIVNASCGDTGDYHGGAVCSDCKPKCTGCPWATSLTGSLCNHSTRTVLVFDMLSSSVLGVFFWISDKNDAFRLRPAPREVARNLPCCD